MANNLKFITVLIFTMFNFSFIYCQFYLESRTYRSRKSGPGTFHLQRKASDLTDMDTSEFRDVEDRVEHPDHKVPEVPKHVQASVDMHPTKRKTQNEKITEDDTIHEKKRKSGSRFLNEKVESSEYEEDDSKSSQSATEQYYLRKGHHAKKSAARKHEEICHENCFTPHCKVECTGVQSSAACSAPNCKALTRGEDSASLCAGEKCHSLCFKDECISGCEGLVCIVKCHGQRCHAVSEGEASGCVCMGVDCVAYGNGLETDVKCHGDRCQAQCMGEKCTAACNGTKCLAGCTGIDCKATCVGKNCQNLEHVGEIAYLTKDTHSQEFTWSTTKGLKPDLLEDGYYGNRNFLQTQKKLKQNDKSISDTEEEQGPEEEERRPEKDNHGNSNDIGKVKLDYSVNIQVKPALANYIRDKIYNIKNMAAMTNYLRYIPEIVKGL